MMGDITFDAVDFDLLVMGVKTIKKYSQLCWVKSIGTEEINVTAIAYNSYLCCG